MISEYLHTCMELEDKIKWGGGSLTMTEYRALATFCTLHSTNKKAQNNLGEFYSFVSLHVLLL